MRVEVHMAQDAILEAIQRQRQKSTLRQFIENPMKAIEEKPYLVYVISGVFSTIFAVTLLYLHVEISDVIIFTLILAFIPAGLYEFHKQGTRRKIEAEFPKLMRDISLAVQSGMTIRAAFSVTAQGEYGALTPAIKHLDNLMTWGVSFEEAMLYLARKYPTPLIKRTVSTIIEASKSGGEIGPILQNVTIDAEQTKGLEKRRRAETQPYLLVGYMSFFVFMAVILIISHYFIGMMAQMSAETKVTEMSGMQFRISSEDIAMYKTLFFHALIVQGIFTGLFTGKIAEGTVLAGMKHSLIFVVIAVLVYRLLI